MFGSMSEEHRGKNGVTAFAVLKSSGRSHPALYWPALAARDQNKRVKPRSLGGKFIVKATVSIFAIVVNAVLGFFRL